MPVCMFGGLHVHVYVHIHIHVPTCMYLCGDVTEWVCD